MIMEGPLRAFVSREYSERQDFLIRQLQGPIHPERLKDLECRSPSWMATLHRLGCSSAVDLAKETRHVVDPEIRVIAKVLHRNGILRTLDELKAWPGFKKHHVMYGRHGESDERIARGAEAVIRQLKAVGADRLAILKSCQDPGNFMPRQLADNIAELQRSEIAPAQVLEAVGNLIWTSLPDRWPFLIDDLQVRAPADFGLFRDILASRGKLPTELARTLVAEGASLAELAACQAMFTRAGQLDDPEDAVGTWKTLSGAPFGFAVTDFAKVREYLRKRDRLAPFLEVLKRHGLTSPEAVLAFDECFASLDDVSLATLLAIALPRQGQESLANVADWVRRAHKVGSYNAGRAARHSGPV